MLSVSFPPPEGIQTSNQIGWYMIWYYVQPPFPALGEFGSWVTILLVVLSFLLWDTGDRYDPAVQKQTWPWIAGILSQMGRLSAITYFTIAGSLMFAQQLAWTFGKGPRLETKNIDMDVVSGSILAMSGFTLFQPLQDKIFIMFQPFSCSLDSLDWLRVKTHPVNRPGQHPENASKLWIESCLLCTCNGSAVCIYLCISQP